MMMTKMLGQEMDEASNALAEFDVRRLEAVEQRLRGVTAEHLALSLAKETEFLPELLRRHSVLGQVIDRTAANLKVLVSVLRLRTSEVSR